LASWYGAPLALFLGKTLVVKREAAFSVGDYLRAVRDRVSDQGLRSALFA